MNFNGSVHQHHLFYLKKIQLDYNLAQIKLRCCIQWSLTMDCTTANLLEYVIFIVQYINIILGVFLWYLVRDKIVATMNNTLLICYVNINNSKWTHYVFATCIEFLLRTSLICNNLIYILNIYYSMIINRP